MTDNATRGFQLHTTTPATLGVSGELTFDTAAAALLAIQAALAKGGVERLDLAGLRRSDSAGLACVLAVAADAAGRRQALRIIGMPAGMQALAQVCEVDALVA